MRKVAGEHPFCVLIYMNSYIFHICFNLFILLSYLIFDFVRLTLSLADTHGIAKYARTNIRDIHTHAHTPKKKLERLENKEGGSGKKERSKRERTKRKGGELKLGEKRRESSKRNYYIISPRVIIKAIIIITGQCIVLNFRLHHDSHSQILTATETLSAPTLARSNWTVFFWREKTLDAYV